MHGSVAGERTFCHGRDVSDTRDEANKARKAVKTRNLRVSKTSRSRSIIDGGIAIFLGEWADS